MHTLYSCTQRFVQVSVQTSRHCVQERREYQRLHVGVRLSYINSLIHRIVPGGWIQGGDIVDGSGSGGESICGATIDG